MLANRINSITIRNFRSIEEVTVELEDLTVLVGANGTGKSNFLKALGFVRDVIREGLVGALKHQDTLIQRLVPFPGEKVPDIEIEIRLTLAGQNALFGFAIGIDTENGFALKHEIAEVGIFNYEVRGNAMIASFDIGNRIISSFPNALMLQVVPLIEEFAPFKALNEYLTNFRAYSIFPNTLRPLKEPGQPKLLLEEDGQNLPTVLREFINNASSKHKENFYQSLEQIASGIDISNPIAVSSIGAFLLVKIKHTDTRGTLDLSSESDGTLRALALLMALNQTPGPSIIGIEEPELMLHPEAMGVLADVIREASFRSQVILTTHSPDLITNFPVKSLRIVELEDGVTKIGPVREGNRQSVEDKLFGSGDLLRLGGLARE